MESAKRVSHYRKIKSIIKDNKLECNSEYKLNEINFENMKQVNNNNIIKDVLCEIQKVQKNTNDELHEFKNRNMNNKLNFKNEKNKMNKSETEVNDKLVQKNNVKNNTSNKNIRYKDVPLTVFFK